jgi:alpha-N-acetylglucosaminidase
MAIAYYGNVCTPSYSFWNWDWARWEREIDWLALYGVNLPLVITGQEVVWYSIWRELGLAEAEIFDYFSGPAFLAWHRMGNLQGWGGPLSVNFLQQQRELTRKILSRMRSLGMKAVLPAFHGHVPRTAAAVLEQMMGRPVAMTNAPAWFAFKGASAQYSSLSFVEPSDPAYVELGRRFIREQTRVYGTDSYYAVDQFNEMEPASKEPEYLSTAGLTQYESLRAADPNAIWVVQGWQFLHKVAEFCFVFNLFCFTQFCFVFCTRHGRRSTSPITFRRSRSSGCWCWI